MPSPEPLTTVVDVEKGLESNPSWTSAETPSGQVGHCYSSDQGEEEYNQLLPKSPQTSTGGNNGGSLTNLSRFLSRSQNHIQIVPLTTQKGTPTNSNTSLAMPQPPFTLAINNNNGDVKNLPSSSFNPTSPTPSSPTYESTLSPTTPTAFGFSNIPYNNGVTFKPSVAHRLSISVSAPPSPSAGSKKPGHGHHNFNNTLTNIDSKLRKWISSKFGRIRKRVVFKNGEVNLSQMHVSKRKRRYLADLFTTLVDIQWRWTLLIFTLSFLLSWLFFAVVWWTIGYLHGDLEPENLLKASLPDPEWTTCFSNFQGFTSAFLFSIETQHTIGYGFRYTTEECPFAIITMCIQSILGVMIQSVMVGIIFAKMSRPKKRTHTIMFSRNAVVCQRDGKLCLMFRVGDMRKSHIISANVRAQLIKRKVTKEGEILMHYQHELKVGVDSDQAQIFFIWPVMVVHKIEKDSPLYGIAAADLIKQRFEIVVILEGVIETTGSTTQARSSYLPSEILWGHRFEPMVFFRKDVGEYAVDHHLFNHTYEIDTPLCSAKDLDELNRLQEEMKRQGTNKLLASFQIPNRSNYSPS